MLISPEHFELNERYRKLLLKSMQQEKIIESIGSIKEADLKLKGVNSGSDTEGQIFRELVYRIMH